jgi:hypothetical protein
MAGGVGPALVLEEYDSLARAIVERIDDRIVRSKDERREEFPTAPAI